jgi:hypothetical protein
MGMDLIGMRPKTERGEYLYLSSQRWVALAALCCAVVPTETELCKSWQFNDGDGRHAEECELLAQRLEEALADGSIDECLGGSKSDYDPQCLEDSMSIDDTCVICLESHPDYRWLKSHVPIFIHFLRVCGGFRIW